jgi:hypothetical protein
MEEFTGKPNHIKDVLNSNLVRYNWGNKEELYENIVIHPDDKQWTKKELEDELADQVSKFPLLYLRDLRNIKLQETDWWAGSDLTMTSAQTAYRQALRDLPSTSSPALDSDGILTGVTWPTKP